MVFRCCARVILLFDGNAFHDDRGSLGIGFGVYPVQVIGLEFKGEFSRLLGILGFDVDDGFHRSGDAQTNSIKMLHGFLFWAANWRRARVMSERVQRRTRTPPTREILGAVTMPALILRSRVIREMPSLAAASRVEQVVMVV